MTQSTSKSLTRATDNQMVPDNIGFVIVSGEFGGAETVLYNILEDMGQTDANVFLFANEVVVSNFEEINGVTTTSLGDLPYRSFLADVGFDSRFTRAKRIIRERCAELDIDLLVLNLPSSLCVADFDADYDLVYVMHGNAGLEHDSFHSELTQTRIVNELLKKIRREMWIKLRTHKLNKVDRIITVCEYFRNLLTEIGVDKEITVIRNGVDLSIRDQRQVLVDDSAISIFYSGGCRDVKGWDILLHALRHLNFEEVEFMIYILRDVPEDHVMRKYINNYALSEFVEFVGYCPREEYLDYMYSCDIVCMPSYSEGIAPSMMEAFTLGKPIVATDVGGTGEIVTHKENGYLCQTTGRSIAEGLLYFLNSPDRIDRVGKRNREKANNYCWERTIKEYKHFLSYY